MCVRDFFNKQCCISFYMAILRSSDDGHKYEKMSLIKSSTELNRWN